MFAKRAVFAVWTIDVALTFECQCWFGRSLQMRELWNKNIKCRKSIELNKNDFYWFLFLTTLSGIAKCSKCSYFIIMNVFLHSTIFYSVFIDREVTRISNLSMMMVMTMAVSTAIASVAPITSISTISTIAAITSITITSIASISTVSISPISKLRESCCHRKCEAEKQNDRNYLRLIGRYILMFSLLYYCKLMRYSERI